MPIKIDVDPRIPIVQHKESQTSAAMLILRDKQSNSAIPILIGIMESVAIRMELLGGIPPRPQTHDLLKNILVDIGGVVVTKAVITELRDDTYYSLLYLTDRNGDEHTQDCRPSDAIALALRFNAPIYVDEKLWFETLASEATEQALDRFEKWLNSQK